MRDYIIRRVLLMIPTIIVVSIITFLLIRFIPGSVIEIMVSEQGGSSATLGIGRGEHEIVIDYDAIRARLGLDKPVWTQYGEWVSGIITSGDFGKSLWSDKPVTQEMWKRVPVTFELGVLAFLIAMMIALPVGIISAIRQDTWMDYVGRSFAIISLATPAFWLATLILVFPSIWWGWSPPMEYIKFGDDPLGNLGQFIIPAALLGTAMSATTMRMLRTTMLDVLRQDYIRTAWSKGLRERIVIMRHVMKNAMIPVITMVSGQLMIMVGGAVIMEQIFNLPGMGRLFLYSIFRRDYPYVSGINFILASIGLVMILLTDLSYAYLDPRIRYK